ncbi:hypothetical protein FRC18_012403 [Serendipita sp. 400]|nr:hypothetical protein FRC18_012403 [Serendipita sp. 400]
MEVLNEESSLRSKLDELFERQSQQAQEALEMARRQCRAVGQAQEEMVRNIKQRKREIDNEDPSEAGPLHNTVEEGDQCLINQPQVRKDSIPQECRSLDEETETEERDERELIHLERENRLAQERLKYLEEYISREENERIIREKERTRQEEEERRLQDIERRRLEEEIEQLLKERDKHLDEKETIERTLKEELMHLEGEKCTAEERLNHLEECIHQEEEPHLICEEKHTLQEGEECPSQEIDQRCSMEKEKVEHCQECAGGAPIPDLVGNRSSGWWWYRSGCSEMG